MFFRVFQLKTIILYVYLLLGDSYFSGIRAESSALIHEYANIFHNIARSSTCSNS